MVGTTYGYHYGGPGGRSDRYRNVTSKASGLQIRHSGNTKQASSMQFKSKYDKLDATTKSALDKFTNKPDSQLTSAERDSLYHIEPWFYLQYVRSNHPNKVEFHRDRLKSFTGFKRNMEDNGLVPKESSETQAAKQMVENIEAPVEQAKPAETNTNQPAITPEKQAAQGMVDNSKPAKKNEQPAWVTTPWRETMYRLGDKTPEINPSEKYEPSSNNLWDFPELAVSRNSSRIPNYLKDAYERKVERDIRKQRSRIDLDNINPITGHSMSPARYNSFSSIYGRNEPAIMGLATAGVLGLGGLGLYGKYALQKNDEELAQTQVPYRMEPEVQPDPTLKQQYAAQNIPSFSSKINNLFDLYQQQEQLMREKEIAASQAYQNALDMGQRIATGTGYAPELKEGNFEFPQKLPPIGATLDSVDSLDTADIPEELDTPLLRNASWDLRKIADDANKLLPMPSQSRQKGVRPLLKSGYRIESNNPVQTEPRNNAVTAEQVAANQMVNQYAGIPIEVARAKNSGYTPPFLTTDAIWDRVRKAGLSSPEQAIRSGLFTPAEVRYITENDLWRYR